MSYLYSAYNGNRLTAVRDAITFELRQRMLNRYAEMGTRLELARHNEDYVFINPLFVNDYPALPLPYLANSMEHARTWDLRTQQLGRKARSG